MKKKLFTLLTLLLCICSTAWAEDFTIVPSFKQNYTKLSYGLVDITLDGSGNKISSSAINAGSKGANAEFTISTTKSDIFLKTITFSDFSNGTLSIKEGSNGSYDADTKIFTAATNQTTVSFVLTNTKSGSTSSVKVPSIVIDGGANIIETLTMTAVSDGAITTSAKINNESVTSAVTLTTTGASASENILTWNNGKNITFTSDNNIKYIAFLTDDDKILSSNSIKIGDTKLTSASWTGSQKTITFTNSTGAGRTIKNIFVITEVPGPSLSVTGTANPFTYVVGNGPSTTQTFTVTGSNLTSTITATLSNTDAYEMKTGDGEYGAGPLADLASGTAVQVRLKSGLAKGDSYNGNLTFSSTGADNKVVALSGSVTGQTYTVTYDLNGASGDAPTQAAQEEGAVFALAAAPTRDCYTFNGWLCSVDDVPGATYNASENYTMTAGATKFTAQWTGNYASGAYTFENNATVGTTPSKTVSDATYDAFQVDNLFFSGMRIQYEAGVYSGSGDDFKGWKIKTKDATIKFIVESDKTVVVGVGNLTNGAKISYTATNGTENNNVALTAKTDNTYNVKGGTMVTIKTDGASTVTLKKIFILDPATTTVTATVGKNGYTTFASPYALDLTDANRPAGLKAYKATRTNASLTFTELHQTVPAGTGLLLLGETKEGSYTIKVVASGDAVASNALIGVTSPTPKKSVADNTYYFVMKKAANADDALKFAPLTTASNVTIPAGKAYIEVPNSAFPTTTESRELSISFDEGNATRINGIEEVAPVTKTRKVVKNGRLVIETANGEFTIDGARVK